jgi:hypothetical protein
MAKGALQASTDPQKPDQPPPLSYLAGFCNKIGHNRPARGAKRNRKPLHLSRRGKQMLTFSLRPRVLAVQSPGRSLAPATAPLRSLQQVGS